MKNTRVIEVRPDHGGQDAELFASELTASFKKMLTRSNYDARISTLSQIDKGFLIETNAPRSKISWLHGTHTIQRIPKGSSARHTSSAKVIVRENSPHTYQPRVDPDDIRIDRYRGRGSGGQRKNKVSTAIRLVHIPTGICITRETGRSQNDNLESAMEQLESMLMRQEHQKQNSLLREVRSSAGDDRSFIHNAQRGVVTRLSDGSTWEMKRWNAGKIDLNA
jgi:peptide chain release factor 1